MLVNKICIIAGEDSGDLFGAKIIEQIKVNNPDACFFGIGGIKMIEQGLNSIVNMKDLSIIGFTEIIPKLPKIFKIMSTLVNYIKENQPDIVITIDSPGFNFRLAKKLQYLRAFGIELVHVVAPSVWAYKPKRAIEISKLYDKLACFLPFEPDYFTIHGLNAKFIGHPIFEYDYQPNLLKQNFLSKYYIDSNKPVILVKPGSRIGEIKKLWPILDKIIEERTDCYFIVPVSSFIKDFITKNFYHNPRVKFIDINDKNCCYAYADFAIIKSGTSSLEASFHKIPHIVIYKINKISELIVRMTFKIKFVSLINIISEKLLAKELLQDNCNENNIKLELSKLVNLSENEKNILRNEYEINIKKLSNQNNCLPSAEFCKFIGL